MASRMAEPIASTARVAWLFHRIAVTGLLILAVSLMGAGLYGLRFNLTSSMPVGLYRASHSPAHARRGSIVLACLSPPMSTLVAARAYVPKGGHCSAGLAPIGKLVAAVAGDTVAVTEDGLLVNGVPVASSRALSNDSRGRPLPSLPRGEYVVRAHTLWLVAPYDRSFDSRYIGAIAESELVGEIQPVWTIGRIGDLWDR